MEARSCWWLCAWGRRGHWSWPVKRYSSNRVRLAWSLVSPVQESTPYWSCFFPFKASPAFLSKIVPSRGKAYVSPQQRGVMASSRHGAVPSSAPALASSVLHIIPPGPQASCWHLRDAEVCSWHNPWPVSAWSGAGGLPLADWCTRTLAACADPLVPFCALHPGLAQSVYSVSSAVGQYDTSHASTMAVLLALSGQTASVPHWRAHCIMQICFMLQGEAQASFGPISTREYLWNDFLPQSCRRRGMGPSISSLFLALYYNLMTRVRSKGGGSA